MDCPSTVHGLSMDNPSVHGQPVDNPCMPMHNTVIEECMDNARAIHGLSMNSSWTIPVPVSYTHLTLPTICSV
eukprot:2146981-Lingulodinium_polyedra.AAC.1